MSEPRGIDRFEGETFKHYVERQLTHLRRELSWLRSDQDRRLDKVATAQERIDAALASDDDAIRELGERVTSHLDQLNQTVASLEATIEQMKGEGVNVEALEAHLDQLKSAAAAIDPASPPGGGGEAEPGTEPGGGV